jgi:hypothetical protein
MWVMTLVAGPDTTVTDLEFVLQGDAFSVLLIMSFVSN